MPEIIAKMERELALKRKNPAAFKEGDRVYVAGSGLVGVVSSWSYCERSGLHVYHCQVGLRCFSTTEVTAA